MPMELVRNLPYDHPYRWDGTLFGGPKLWRPTEISTALWLDAEDASTITLNGSTVSQWNDKSGNGRNATQATAAAQPTYVASSIGGKPALVFDGASSDWMNTGTLNVAMQNDYTVLAALATTNTSTGSFWYLVPGFLGGERGGVGADHGLGFNGLTPITGVGGPADAMLQATSPVTSGSPAIAHWDRASTTGTCRWYLNGTSNGQGTGETGARTYNNGMALGSMWENGGGQWLSFRVGEIVVASSVLPTDNRQRLEGYLAWKWGLESNLPANHPYKLLPPTV
jgi:hypothetical protein